MKLSRKHLDFLRSTLKHDCPQRFRDFENTLIASVFEMEDDLANTLQEWCMNQLQVSGFDKNSELTEQGVLIDELIDFFYQGYVIKPSPNRY